VNAAPGFQGPLGRVRRSLERRSKNWRGEEGHGKPEVSAPSIKPSPGAHIFVSAGLPPNVTASLEEIRVER